MDNSQWQQLYCPMTFKMVDRRERRQKGIPFKVVATQILSHICEDQQSTVFSSLCFQWCKILGKGCRPKQKKKLFLFLKLFSVWTWTQFWCGVGECRLWIKFLAWCEQCPNFAFTVHCSHNCEPHLYTHEQCLRHCCPILPLALSIHFPPTHPPTHIHSQSECPVLQHPLSLGLIPL